MINGQRVSLSQRERDSINANFSTEVNEVSCGNKVMQVNTFNSNAHVAQ